MNKRVSDTINLRLVKRVDSKSSSVEAGGRSMVRPDGDEISREEDDRNHSYTDAIDQQ